MWAGYISFERGLRNVREARSLYKRGHSRRLQEGGQLLLCQAWLRFEREEGRLASQPLSDGLLSQLEVWVPVIDQVPTLA